MLSLAFLSPLPFPVTLILSIDDSLKVPLLSHFWFVARLPAGLGAEYGLVCFVLSAVCTSPCSRGPWGRRNSVSPT